jgi:dTDP-4-dehydrorhamnose 3,5-epimerase-like enzyme
MQEPKLIDGKRLFDNRGSVSFSNAFSFSEIIRFYIVHNYNKNFIRAWHGHLKEKKFITCIQGTFQVSCVRMDKTKNPSKKNKVFTWYLNAGSQNIISIPEGYANGSMSLEDNSKLLIFSTSTLESSLKDDYRFPVKYWNSWDIVER